MKVTNSLVNIKAITAHFNPKIEAWLAAQQLSTPTEDQILEVVKSNYDSLTLKLQVFTFNLFQPRNSEVHILKWLSIFIFSPNKYCRTIFQ